MVLIPICFGVSFIAKILILIESFKEKLNKKWANDNI